MLRKLAGTQECYQIKNSLMLDSSQSQYLSRTTGATSEGIKHTTSVWFKRGKLGSVQGLWGGYVAIAPSNNILACIIDSSDRLWIRAIDNAGIIRLDLLTNRVFRDISAHYHVVFQFDPTLPTPTAKIYVNNDPVTSFATNVNTLLQNVAYAWLASNSLQVVGAYCSNMGAVVSSFDGYVSECMGVPNQILDPSYFGRNCPISGEWEPIKPRVSNYGTNGFYLEFKNAAALGTDTSGKGNNWTTNGGIVAANQYVDTPTNNFAVINMIQPYLGSGMYGIKANTGLTGTLGATPTNMLGTMALNGKMYYEILAIANVGYGISIFGVSNATKSSIIQINIGIGGDYTTYGTYGCAVDVPNGKIWIRNSTGAWIGGGDPAAGTVPTATLSMTSGSFFPLIGISRTSGYDNVGYTYSNFGQRPFIYPAPSGFKSLCTRNLPTPSIKRPENHFSVKLYTGNGSAQAISGLKFSPGLVWLKSRSAATDHALYDSERGATKDLASNLNSPETTQAQGLTAFSADGFNLGSLAKLNTNLATYVALVWSKGTVPGMDIVPFIGTGAVQNINHNLGVTPAVIIYKDRVANPIMNWIVMHKALANMTSAYLNLNNTNGVGTLGTAVNAPTSSQFSAGPSIVNNGAGGIAYLFAEVPGFSKFGTYVGNGSDDGPFVYCGFRPAFVLIKTISGNANHWEMLDSKRPGYNPIPAYLLANDSGVEGSGTGCANDFLSNGFKPRKGTDGATNAAGYTYVFMAFAEMPTKYALAR